MDESGVIAVGATRSIEAGDTLVVRDRNGQEFAVEGKESEVVMDFLKAFDTWYTVSKVKTQGPVLGALWSDVVRLWNCLPPRVVREMPSFKSAAIGLRTHSH